MASSGMQFQYNADYPSSPQAKDPLDFPPADPNPCARITTRVYHPRTNQVATIQNVLVKTRMPSRMELDDDDDDDSTTDSDHSELIVEDEMEDDDDDQQQRAYWMQRTVREAIYGRVLYAIVLKKRARNLEGDWEVTEEQCAIKEMSWQHIRKERDRLAEDPIKEVSAMQYLQKKCGTHLVGMRQVMETNIMMPLDLLSDDRHLYSVMPYCNGGELFERLDMNERFPEEEARYWMYQVLNGLENLQKSGICHRDMSLENLLVHENGCLIIDMGMCLRIPFADDSFLSDSLNNMSLGDENGGPLLSSNNTRHLITPQGTCGKWLYMSPEIYQNAKPFDGFAIDMWAAGVILFLMLTGFPPWERACATDERFKYMTAGYLVQMLTEWNIPISQDAMDLLQRMLFLDPKDRLSLAQVKAHPWMVNGRRDAPPGLL